MSDDFQDIKARMAEHHGSIEGFLTTVGATLIQCQAFEDRLRQYKVLVHDSAGDSAGQTITDRLAASRKRDTLGSLLKDLAKKTKIETKTQALLDEFLAERNWFIHHLEYQHSMEAYDPSALVPLVQRMYDLQARSKHLQQDFVELAIRWTETQGFTREQIDAGARQALDKGIKPPIR